MRRVLSPKQMIVLLTVHRGCPHYIELCQGVQHVHAATKVLKEMFTLVVVIEPPNLMTDSPSN